MSSDRKLRSVILLGAMASVIATVIAYSIPAQAQNSSAALAQAAPPHVHEIPPNLSREDSFFGNLFQVFTPRKYCMYEQPSVIWLSVISDLMIALAYFSIPLALMRFVSKRQDLAFNWMFKMFAAFILACGTTHLFGVWAIWQPLYKVDGLVKLFTGMISITTAVLLWQLVPKAILLPSPGQLRLANEELHREIAERKRAEEAQKRMASELEQRVKERTSELASANTSLRAEITARTAAETERNKLLESERALRAQAEDANRLKDEFLATLSHELRTPLNAILGWSQLLRAPNRSQDDTRHGLETIERNARVQSEMIEDLLDMSRIISGKVRLDVQRVDLAGVIEAAIDAVRPSAQAKNIRLVPVLDPGAGPVSGDPGRLQQVIWNLLSNAIKFTPKGGKVQIELARVNSHVEIAVADTGVGIKGEFIPHLFERFRQADASSTRRHSGLGLGLAIVRHLVEMHGGVVRAKSDGENHGATFTVELPLAAALPETGLGTRQHPRRRAASSDYAPPRQSLKGVHVLVVDDEPDARELIQEILSQYEAKVTTAASTAEAITQVQIKVPDVLISDIGMPDEDGYALIRKLRNLPANLGGNIPALALTAFARSEDRMHALHAGFQMHTSKPVEPAELVAVVASLVGRNGAPTDAD